MPRIITSHRGLDTPLALQVTAVSTTTISLSWNASSGATHYNIYRDRVLIASPSALSFTDTGLASAHTYTYAVQGVDNANNVSGGSAPVSGTTTSVSAPTKLVRLDGSATGLPFLGGLPNYNTWQAAVNAAVAGDLIQVQQIQQANPNAWDFYNVQGSNACDISRLISIGTTAVKGVTIQIRPGDYIRISSNLYILTGQGAGSAYLTIDATQCGGFKVGVSDLPQGQGWFWDVNNGSCLPNTAPQMGVNFYSGIKNIKILGPGVDFSKPNGQRSKCVIYGARNYTGNLSDGSTNDIMFDGVEVYLHGNLSVWNATLYVNAGNTFDMGAVGHLVRNCAINDGGHDAATIDGANGIWHNVQIGQDWSNVPGGPVRTLAPSNTAPGGAGTLTTWLGCRCASIQPNWRSTGSPNGQSGGNSNTAWGLPYGNLFLLGVIFNDANDAGGSFQVDTMLTKVDGTEIVGFGTYFLDNPVGWAYNHSPLGANDTTNVCVSYNCFFNSTMVGVSQWTRWVTGGVSGSWVIPSIDFESNRSENNILYGLTGNNLKFSATFNLLSANQLSATEGLTLAQSAFFGGGTWPSWWKGGSFANNLLIPAASPVAGWDNITLYTGPNGGTATFDAPLAAWSQNVYNNIRCTTGSGANRVDFTNVGSAPNRQITGLTLAGTSTQGIGAGKPHTTVTQAYSGGTTLFVAHPRVFAVCDTASRDSSFIPYNTYFPYIAVNPIAGGTAAQAAGNIVKVLGINRATGALTLANPLPNGAAVGSGVWYANCDANGGPKVFANAGAAQ